MGITQQILTKCYFWCFRQNTLRMINHPKPRNRRSSQAFAQFGRAIIRRTSSTTPLEDPNFLIRLQTLTMPSLAGYWPWCSLICEFDIVNAILRLVVCHSKDISFAQTCEASCGSISQFFTTTSFCLIKCSCNNTCYRRLLNYFLPSKYSVGVEWGPRCKLYLWRQ